METMTEQMKVSFLPSSLLLRPGFVEVRTTVATTSYPESCYLPGENRTSPGNEVAVTEMETKREGSSQSQHWLTLAPKSSSINVCQETACKRGGLNNGNEAPASASVLFVLTRT